MEKWNGMEWNGMKQQMEWINGRKEGRRRRKEVFGLTISVNNAPDFSAT